MTDIRPENAAGQPETDSKGIPCDGTLDCGGEPEKWYVLRDLKRANSKTPAYKYLKEMGFKVFTPMKRKIDKNSGRPTEELVAVVTDLLFTRSTREALDQVVNAVATLQYRYVKGRAYCDPMTVRDAEMDNFIRAATAAGPPVWYSPTELPSLALGKKVRINGGSLDGCDGRLVAVKGTKKKRLVVELGGLLAVGVEISSGTVEIIGEDFAK